MKLEAIPLILGLGGGKDYWNDKRMKMLPAYLGIEPDEKGEIPRPSSAKQIKIWQARAARLGIPAPKTPL